MKASAARLTAVVIIAVLTVTACSGDATDDASATLLTRSTIVAQTIPTTSEQPVPTASSSGHVPATDQPVWVAPSAEFAGLVIAEFGSGQLEFRWYGEQGEAIRIPLSNGVVGCGLDLTINQAGIEVGLDPFGGGSDIERIGWGSSSWQSAQRPVEPEATRELQAAAVTVAVDSTQEPNEIVVASEDETLRFIAGDDDHPFVQLHGFDGRYLLWRAEPAEPACTRGTLLLTDLVSGHLACMPGTMHAIELVPDSNMAAPVQVTPPAVSLSGCSGGTISTLTELLSDSAG